MTATTLTADQSADSELAYVAAAGPRTHGFLIQIEDEYQFVEWRGDQFARPWQVQRGFLGSTPAAHVSTTAVVIEPEIVSGAFALPASLPEVPATPTAQNITDALVALGLVTQAAP